jgi:hypothetical protein
MTIKRRKELALKLDQLKDQLAEIRDSDLNDCGDEHGGECNCHRFDEILDLLENLKEI